MTSTFRGTRAPSAAGTAAANSATSYLNIGLLLYALRKKLKRLDLGALKTMLLPTVAAALAVLALVAYLANVCHAAFETDTLLRRMVEVFVPALVGALVYWGLLLWARVQPAWDLLNVLRGRT